MECSPKHSGQSCMLQEAKHIFVVDSRHTHDITGNFWKHYKCVDTSVASWGIGDTEIGN